jgi:hypothetical protein
MGKPVCMSSYNSSPTAPYIISWGFIRFIARKNGRSSSLTATPVERSHCTEAAVMTGSVVYP